MSKAIEDNLDILHLPWVDQLSLMLHAARAHRGLSVGDLAKEINMSKRHLYRIEAGESSPSAELIDKWLRACGTELRLELRSKW